MNQVSVESFFNNRSIAIIGASPKPGFPSRVPTYLLKFGYPGKVYPVNPNYDELFGLKAYPNVGAIPDAVDLALIIVSAKHVISVLKECVEKKIMTAVIFSSGFSETGTEEGKQRQEEINALCNETGMRILGPNTFGYVDVSHKLSICPTTLMERIEDFDQMEDSSIAFISQSGALGVTTYAEALERGSSFRYFVSTGNEMNIEVSEFASYIIEDPKVNTVGIYIESIKNPAQLKALAEKSMKLCKPVAVLKVGKSEVGVRAAASHTGSIVGSDEVYDAYFRQHGLLRVKNTQELLDFLMLSSKGRKMKGNRIGILTPSGGAGSHL